MTRIASGDITKKVYFVAVDATDFTTRETGLSSFTVVRSRNGAADVTYTTPTVTEIDNTTMPGLYALLLDEDMTLDAGDDEQEYALHITHAGMAPVTRVIELYRPKATPGNTLDVHADGDAEANVTKWRGTAAPAEHTSGYPIVTVKDGTGTGEINTNGGKVVGVETVDTVTGGATAAGVSAVETKVDTVDSNVDAILADTGTDGVVVAAASKTGYALSAAGVQAIWDALTSALTTVGSIGKHLVDSINATISSRASQASVDTVDDLLDTEIAAIKAKTDLIPASPAAVGDIPSAATIADAVLDEASADHVAAGSVGERIERLDLIASGGAGELTAARAALLANLDRAISAILTTQMTESYAADGVAPTAEQALFWIQQLQTELSFSGTTGTVKKIDGSTTAGSVSINDADAPTSITRSS